MSESAEFIAKFRESTGRLPSHVELSKKLGISPQKAVAALIEFTRSPEPVSHEEIEKPTGGSTDLLGVGLFVVAAMTFILSIYFTALWFTSMFNLFIAGMISVSMVSYMVLSPQVAGRVKGVVKGPLWASFAVALVFSMGSTVAGQYNQLTESVDVGAAAERETLDILRAEERELLEAIEADREQQAFHQRTLEQLSTTAEDRKENWSYIQTERNKVTELAKQIEVNRDRVRQIREQIRQEVEEGNIGVTEKRDDFYSWLATLFGLSRDQIEFLISALPAVFIDVIAALSLNLALRKTGTTSGKMHTLHHR